MFVSFILRATISFVKENVLVNSVGFSFDVKYDQNGDVVFLNNGSVSTPKGLQDKGFYYKYQFE